MMKQLIVFLLVLSTYSVYGQGAKLPKWFEEEFYKKGLGSNYNIQSTIKPAYLKADFNGDGTVDIAVIIVEKRTSKVGILLIYGKTKKYVVFGASHQSSSAIDGKDNLEWISGWKLYAKVSAAETRNNSSGDIIGTRKMKVKNKGIYIWANEGEVNISGEIIVWDGKKFVWIHQGD